MSRQKAGKPKAKPAKAKRPNRVSTYTEAMALLICEEVAKKNPVHRFAGTRGFPSETTIYKWLGENPPFAEMYARARARAAERYAHDALDISGNVGKVILEKGLDGTETPTTITPEVARVKIDTLKWAAGKFAPRVYGERIQQEVTLQGFDWSKATPEQLKAIAEGRPPT